MANDEILAFNCSHQKRDNQLLLDCASVIELRCNLCVIEKALKMTPSLAPKMSRLCEQMKLTFPTPSFIAAIYIMLAVQVDMNFENSGRSRKSIVGRNMYDQMALKSMRVSKGCFPFHSACQSTLPLVTGEGNFLTNIDVKK